MVPIRRLILPFLVLLILLTCLATADGLPNIRMSLPPVMGSLPLAFAQGWGLFEKHNLRVELIGLSDNQERSAALMAGDIDGMVCDVTTAILLVSGGTDVVITSAAYQENQTDSLIIISPRSFNINSLEELLSTENSADKIATIYRSDLEYEIDLLLQTLGYRINKEDRYTYWTDMLALTLWFGSQLVPAAAFPEPYITYITNYPYAGGQLELVRLSDFEGIDLLPSVVVFRREVIEYSPELIEDFYAAYQETIKMINTSSREKLVETGIDEALSLFFPGLTANAVPEGILDSFEIPYFQPPRMLCKEQFEGVLAWAISKRYARLYLAYEELTTDQFLQ